MLFPQPTAGERSCCMERTGRQWGVVLRLSAKVGRLWETRSTASPAVELAVADSRSRSPQRGTQKQDRSPYRARGFAQKRCVCSREGSAAFICGSRQTFDLNRLSTHSDSAQPKLAVFGE